MWVWNCREVSLSALDVGSSFRRRNLLQEGSEFTLTPSKFEWPVSKQSCQMWAGAEDRELLPGWGCTGNDCTYWQQGHKVRKGWSQKQETARTVMTITVKKGQIHRDTTGRLEVPRNREEKGFYKLHGEICDFRNREHLLVQFTRLTGRESTFQPITEAQEVWTWRMWEQSMLGENLGTKETWGWELEVVAGPRGTVFLVCIAIRCYQETENIWRLIYSVFNVYYF